MYEVLVNGKYIYYPCNSTYVIYSASIKQDVGLAGEFEFSVPSNNPNYALLEQGAVVTVIRDGNEFWRGEVKNITYDFDKVAKVYALEDLAWLADEVIAPSYLATESYAQRYQTAIGLYNANRSSDRQFSVGYISHVTSTDTCIWQTEYEDTLLDAIRKCIAKDSGYLRVRRVTNGSTVTRYIDCLPLSGYGKVTTQPIQFGYNLLEYAQEFDLGSLVNVLTPYGDETDTEIYEGVNQRVAGNTISNDTSIATYGRHAKAVIFNGVTDVTALNNLAAAYLGRWSQPQLSLELSAIDLSTVDNMDAIEIGDSVHIIAEPFSIDQWLYVTELNIDIQNPDQNKITLSGNVRTGQTLTSQTADTVETIRNMPSKSSILDAARKNALEILNGAEGGYVKFKTDENNCITELLIQNAELDTNVTKRWRWNLGGLAYQSRPTASDDWNDYAPITAMTMDGGFLADFITTGSLVANNGVYELNMSSGHVTMKDALLTDNVGNMSLSGGDLYMKSAKNGGPGLFAEKTGTDYYACWGSVNSAARANGSYIEVPTYKILQVAKYFDDHGGWA